MISESFIDETNTNKLLELIENYSDLKHFHIRLVQSTVLIKLDTSFGEQTEDVLRQDPILSLSYVPQPDNKYLLVPFYTPNDFDNHEIKRRMKPGYYALENFIKRYATPVPEGQPA